MRILHVAFRRDWAAAVERGAYAESTRGRSLAEEGFIHASTVSQLGPVLSTFYADVPAADLGLLVIDVELLAAAGSPLRWEPPPGLTENFPHVYGPIPVGAVVAVFALDRNGAGWLWPELADLDVVDRWPGDSHW